MMNIFALWTPALILSIYCQMHNGSRHCTMRLGACNKAYDGMKTTISPEILTKMLEVNVGGKGKRTFSRRKKIQSDLMTRITRIWGRTKAGTRISTTYCFFVTSGRRLLEVTLDSVKTFWGEEWALEYNGQSIAFSIVLPLHIVQRAILNIFSV